MTRKYFKLAGLAYLASVTFPILLLWLARLYPANVFNGLVMILILAILTGLIFSRVDVTWLILILTTIGAGFLLLGYVVMPVKEKFLLLIAYPIEASLVTVIRQHIIRWSFFTNHNDEIRHYNSLYDRRLKLRTFDSAEKFYQNELHKIEQHPELDLWSNVQIVSWDQHKQYAEAHPNSHDRILKQITKVLKNNRLKGEFIYFMGDATFLIISPEIPNELVKKVNHIVDTKLSELELPIPVSLKHASVHINVDNSDRFPDLIAVIHFLRRELETKIVTEYIKER